MLRRFLASCWLVRGVGGCGGAVGIPESSSSGQDAAINEVGPDGESRDVQPDAPVVDAGCAGWISVAADNRDAELFASICYGGWGADASTSAVGYIFAGGPYPGVEGLDVVGCANSNPQSPGITLSGSNVMSPGTFAAGMTSYTDVTGSWGVAGDPFQMVITRLDSTGGVIEGTFNARVSHGGNAAHALTGSFHVCHVSDEYAP